MSERAGNGDGWEPHEERYRKDCPWCAKLAAWLHDPPEKALVLMRDPAGHEGGTVAELCRRLFGTEGVPQELRDAVKKADRWASGVDRALRPRGAKAEELERRLRDQVRFWKNGELVHPCAPERIEVHNLLDSADLPDTKQFALQHLELALKGGRPDGELPQDCRTRFLRLWRLAPDLSWRARDEVSGWRVIWELLPADTRTPDHTIWEHLDLTSALASIRAAEERPALLLVSLGPVQAFIAQARSSSDLWAGSHLLSRMAWEAIRPVVEACGPDAVVMPALRGVPFVDWWLAKGCEQSLGVLGWRAFGEGEGPDWLRAGGHDGNPAFSASLPHRFLALVPEGQAEKLAGEIEDSVRRWVRKMAEKAWVAILGEALGERPDLGHAKAKQLEEQLAGFPQVHWAAVPWPVRKDADGGVRDELDPEALRRLAEAFARKGDQAVEEILGEPAELRTSDGGRFTFWKPGPGRAYGLLYEGVDRAHAVAKTARRFEALPQRGWRCTLCGEREFLVLREGDLDSPPGQDPSPWKELAERRPSWAREGERLCAVCALKRLWPVLFAEEAGSAGVGRLEEQARRYVVSTHTMAAALGLAKLAKAGDERVAKLREAVDEVLQELKAKDARGEAFDPEEPGEQGGAEAAGGSAEDAPPKRSWRFFVALPKRVAEDLRKGNGERLRLARRALALQETLEDARREGTVRGRRGERRRVEPADLDAMERRLEEGWRKAGLRLDRYYALLLMDGDRMGAWLSGAKRPSLRACWHGQVRLALEGELDDESTKAWDRWAGRPAPVTAAYHRSLSAILGGLSRRAFYDVVEELFHGKVLYAGGDDLMAMLPVGELLPAMLALRCVFSGVAPGADGDAPLQLPLDEEPLSFRDGASLLLSKGYVGRAWRDNGRRVKLRWWLRAMGPRATASMGAVVVHHKAPLSEALRRLRQAEHAAKAAGRDAFTVDLVKRAGGSTRLTLPWELPGASEGAPGTLREAAPGVLLEAVAWMGARRRGAYRMKAWLAGFPDGQAATDMGRKAWTEALGALLAEELLRGGAQPPELPPAPSGPGAEASAGEAQEAEPTRDAARGSESHKRAVARDFGRRLAAVAWRAAERRERKDEAFAPRPQRGHPPSLPSDQHERKDETFAPARLAAAMLDHAEFLAREARGLAPADRNGRAS